MSVQHWAYMQEEGTGAREADVCLHGLTAQSRARHRRLTAVWVIHRV